VMVMAYGVLHSLLGASQCWAGVRHSRDLVVWRLPGRSSRGEAAVCLACLSFSHCCRDMSLTHRSFGSWTVQQPAGCSAG
jgi:hypothetical protein